MSYKNQQLNVNNVTSHTHTIFDLIATEAGQQKIVDAINNINISAEIGDITVESSDSITHQKLDTLNTTVSNKHLNYETDSVSVANFPTSTEISNFPSSFQVSNFPVSFEVSNLSEVPLITGFATEETLNDISNKTNNLNFFDNDGVLELNTFDSQVYNAIGNVVNAVNDKHLDSTTDSVTVSGTVSIDTTGLALETTLTDVKTAVEKLNNDPVLTDAIQVSIKNASLDVNITGGNSDYSTETKQDTQIEELEKVVNKKGDIEAEIYFFQGETIWADTVPILGMNERNPNGWLYLNENTGNAMNLYYFNGNNETKTLNQVVGQYAVVTNLSTKLNDSLIFAVYTKGTPFFTTRITHSPASGVDMVAGGKYLLFWGSVPADIYPNLPRLNFTSVVTTGPAVPTEEILSVSLNTDSGAPAGDVYIFVESLGVVFNNGTNNESRVLKLLSNNTDYDLMFSNTQFNQLTYTYLSNLNKTNGGLDTYIVNSNLTISNTTFDIGNFPATQNSFITNDEYTPIPITGNVGVSGNVNVNVSNTEPISISGTVDVNSLPAINITNTGFDCNNIANTPLITGFALESGGNLASIKTNSDKLKYTGDDLKTIISNTGFDCNNIANTPLITGFALESGNLATISSKTTSIDNKIYNDNFNTEAIQVQVKNSSLTVDTGLTGLATSALQTTGNGKLDTINTSIGTTNTKLDTIHNDLDGLTFDGSSNLNVNIASGTISVSSVNIKDSSGNNLNSTSNALNSYITNTSVDTHCYASSNGTNWHHLSSDANGQLNIHSKTQDGAGTDITSTLNGVKQSLDVNVSNTVPVSGTFWPTTQPISGTVGISANQSVKIYDGTDTLEVNSIPSSITNTKGLNTQSLLFTSTQNATLEWATSTVSTNFNAIDCNLTAYNRTNSDYQRLTSVQPIGSANTRALETYAYNVGLNNSSNLPLPITSTTTDTTQSLDVVVNNASTTNYQSNKGINIYPNLMKFRTYPIDGNANTGALTALTANTASIVNISSASLIFGASYLKTYYAQISGSGATSKFMMVDYVNASGVEVIGQTFTVTTSSVIFLTNVWGVNRVYLSTSAVQQQLSATETINIAYIQSGTTITTQQITQYGEQNMAYTVPLNSIACITSFQFYASATDALNINKFSANGTRFKLRTWVNVSNLNQIANMIDGGICGFIQAGETIIFSTEGASATGKRIMAEVSVISNT
jgi:hypothetical protein